MLCGLLTPDSGHGTALGFDIISRELGDQAPHRLHDPEFSLYEDLTVEENLPFSRPHPQPRPDARAGGGGARAARPRRAAAAARRERCRAAGSSGSRSPRRLCTSRNCCCSTSPPPASIPQARRDFWDEIHAPRRRGLTVLVSTHYMDEAERCHDIAYIAYGELLARGTARRGDRPAPGLVTWRGEGPGVDRLSRELLTRPGVEMAAPFGLALHVSGTRPRRRSKRPSHPIAGRRSNGRGPSRRSRTCSST